MWHKITTSITKSHKGWMINIVPASKWNKHLSVTITPIIIPNKQYVDTLPSEIRTKIYKAVFTPPAKYRHAFEVVNLYPLIYPWGEATNKAYIYINEKLGQFDAERALRELI